MATGRAASGGADKNARRLLAGCIRKEKACWDEFVDRFSSIIMQQIHHCAAGCAVRPFSQEVEDLYLQILRTLLEDDCKKLREFTWGCSLEKWLRVVTTVAVRDFLEAEYPESLVRRRNGKRHLLQGNRLSAEDRLLVVLLEERNLTPDQIASTMQLSTEAVVGRIRELSSISSERNRGLPEVMAEQVAPRTTFNAGERSLLSANMVERTGS